jgi:hypothetical protein
MQGRPDKDSYYYVAIRTEIRAARRNHFQVIEPRRIRSPLGQWPLTTAITGLVRVDAATEALDPWWSRGDLNP